MKQLNGKMALVTGGSRGIGAAIARKLAAEGAAVALTYTSSADKAAAVAKEIEAEGGRALVIQADSANPATALDVVERTVHKFGGINILVNNAGIFTGGPLDELTLEQLDRIWAIDVRAVFLTSQAAARHMGEGDRIINIGTSLTERLPAPGLTPYAMAKSALTGLTKGLARDLGARGITVTEVRPGPIDTDMNPADGPAGDMLRGTTALGHFGTPDDVAATVVHLAGDAGRYITGTAISVDGGSAA